MIENSDFLKDRKPNRPIIAFSDEYPALHVFPYHTHQWGQLIYASSGTLTVYTQSYSFLLSPSRAIWIPPGIAHEVKTQGQTRFSSLYIDPLNIDNLPKQSCLIMVSSLLKALIMEATDIPGDYNTDGRDGRVIRLLIDEMYRSRQKGQEIPMPQNKSLIRTCQNIIANPAEEYSIDMLATESRMARKTFTRQFRRETGMSAMNWVQNARLMVAIPKLAEGHSITTVAFEVGYNSSSAFTTMFKRVYGTAPKYYQRARANTKTYQVLPTTPLSENKPSGDLGRA
jgi:AraC-like DNA-binding protein